MHAILHLTLSDDIKVAPAEGCNPADIRKVTVYNKLELNVNIPYEEYRRLLLGTVASSVGSLCEHAAIDHEIACKKLIEAIQAQKMAAAVKAANEAAAEAAKPKQLSAPAEAKSNELTAAEKVAAPKA